MSGLDVGEMLRCQYKKPNPSVRRKETQMIFHRKFYLLVVIVGLIVTACAPQTAPMTATPLPPTAVPISTVAPETQNLTTDLDKTLQESSAAHEFSGSILIAEDGQVILSKGYDLANREKKISNDSKQTKYPILGITKQFTAMAVMLLQEQGKLSVKDSICVTLKECPETWQVITIHHLLTQTSGIPDLTEKYFAQDIKSSTPLEQMISDTKKLPLDSQPGEKFNVEDISYILLGKVIEAASGQSYGALLQQNIFEPLQMLNTGFDPNQTDLAVGYADNASAADPFNLWVASSAGGLYSTVEDLYRYDQALYTNKLVSQKVLDTMTTSYVESDREGYGYGYGWYVGLNEPHINKIFGNLNGFNTTFRHYRDDKLTIIILLNEQDDDIVSVANSIPEKLLASVSLLPGSNPTISPSEMAPWSLVAVGDSIAYNSPDDCYGCTGFVDRYADAITKATGRPVKVQNLSQHNGLQIDGLLEELKTDVKRRDALANADIIIVSIGYNDTPWNRDDDPCDGAGFPIWSKYNATCVAAAAEIFRPKLESVFAQIVALRAGKPTIFRTITPYNDWLGGVDGESGVAVPPEATNPTHEVYDAWSEMICQAATANGFTCADTYHAFNGPDGLKPIVGVLTASKANGHPNDKGNEVIARTLADLGYTPLVP
jgi:CubicO group peptidase (beta-lactamase class C family)